MAFGDEIFMYLLARRVQTSHRVGHAPNLLEDTGLQGLWGSEAGGKVARPGVREHAVNSVQYQLGRVLGSHDRNQPGLAN